MKKLLQIITVAIFLLMLFSCSTAEIEETAPQFSIVEDKTDFGGANVVFGLVNDYFIEGDAVLGYIPNTVFADLAYSRLEEVKEKHNIKITFKYVPRAGDAVYLDVVSNDSNYDIIQDESYYLVDFMFAGIFIDFASLDGLDYRNSEKWGSPQMLESMMWEGGLYGVVPAAHPLRTLNSPSGIIAINEELIRRLNVADPRDLFENGQWTFDTFDRVLTEYSYDDTNSGERVYAFLTHKDYIQRSAVLANGGEFVKYDGNSYTAGYYTEAASQALDTIYEWLFSTHTNDILVSGSTLQNFLDKRGVMAIVEAYQMLATTNSIAYHLESFGVVPFPTGPNLAPKTIWAPLGSVDFTLCIPITAQDPELSAMVLDAIYEPFEGFDTKESIIEYLGNNYFSDRRDSEIFVAMVDNAYYYYPKEGLLSMLESISSSVTPTQAQEANKDRDAELIEKYVLPRKETVLALYE